MRWAARDRWIIFLTIASVSGCTLLRIQRDLPAIDPAVTVRGEMASLDDPRFSPEDGMQGLWNPELFVQQHGVGVYFLEPYAPQKIPVLFVHGIGGHPRGFESIIAQLDRTRFQPWIFHYPTGARLQLTSSFLRRVLDDLHVQYKFPKMYVIGHSMGGLVLRACINELARQEPMPYVALFVSISTPWKGHPAATYGVRLSPILIPSWIDMAPGSAFLESVLAEPLPATVPYFLLFGFVDSSASDGTVSLRSELAPAAQSDAVHMYGFSADHDGILRNPTLIALLNHILETGDKVWNELADGPVVNAGEAISAPRFGGQRLPRM